MDLANMGSIYCGVHAVSSNNVKCSNDWKIDQGRQCDPDEETLQTVRTQKSIHCKPAINRQADFCQKYS